MSDGWKSVIAGDEKLPGRVLATFTATGATMLGGVLVAGFGVAGSISAGGMLPLAALFFVGGAVIGGAHGMLLGYAGRPPSLSRQAAAASLAWGAALALLLLPLTAVAGFGVALAGVVVRAGSVGGWIGLAVATALMALLWAWAATAALPALRNASTRWPETRPIALLLPFIAVGVFLLLRGSALRIGALDVRLDGGVGVVLAAALTMWVVAPLMVLPLHMVRARSRAPQPGTEAARETETAPLP